MKEADRTNEGVSHHEARWREALEMCLSRRSFLAGAAATAAISVIGLPRREGVAAEAPLQILAGPVTPMGSTAYDTIQLAQAAAWVNEDPSMFVSDAYFYDGALVYYLLYYRTGDSQWLTRAHVLAKTQADLTVAGMIGNKANVSPINFSTLGMAVHYLLTGYANSLTAVRADAATAVAGYIPYNYPPNSGADARYSAYALMAVVATTLLGGDVDYSSALSTALNALITLQSRDSTGDSSQPNDAWQSYDLAEVGRDGIYIANFYSGLLMECLILYDRVIGDSRIVPAIKKCVDWTWSTQWVALGGGPSASNGNSSTSVTIGTGSQTFTTQSGLTFTAGHSVGAYSSRSPYNRMDGTVTSYRGTSLVINVTRTLGTGTYTDWVLVPLDYPDDQRATGIGCFQYANINAGTENRRSTKDYGCLMGLLLPAWGYLYYKGQGAQYKTNGNTILAGLVPSSFGDVKAFNQAFRSSPRYLGWTSGPTGQPLAPSSLSVR